MQKVHTKRIVTFDLLRGFFILVIIADHLQRWPGIFDWFTGQGRLWVSAAEGFILISGIMIGLIRGHKDKSLPLISVAKKLWKRAFVLYVWSIITSLLALVIVLNWQTTFMPYPPGMDSFIPNSSWFSIFIQSVNLTAVFGWTNFLGLYAIFLAVSPLAIWLLRNNKWWLLLIISSIIWVIGFNEKNMFLSWQLLFFIGSIFGYYFQNITMWWANFKYRKVTGYSIVGLSGSIILASTMTIFGWPIVKSSFSPVTLDTFIGFRNNIDPYFIREELLPAKLLATLVCFLGLFLIVNKYQHQIYKYLGWLLLPFGRNSLFVYIVQGIFVIIVAGLIPAQTNILVNALIIVISVMLIWLITTRVKFLHKIIPS